MEPVTINQGSENIAVASRQELNEKIVRVCPIDPAELAQCDSCQ